MAERRLTSEQRLGGVRWGTDVLDSLLAAGVIQDADLDGLKPRELAHFAAQAVAHAFRGFDVQAARESVPDDYRRRTKTQERTAA